MTPDDYINKGYPEHRHVPKAVFDCPCAFCVGKRRLTYQALDVPVAKQYPRWASGKVGSGLYKALKYLGQRISE